MNSQVAVDAYSAWAVLTELQKIIHHQFVFKLTALEIPTFEHFLYYLFLFLGDISCCNQFMIRLEIKFMYVPEATINYAPNISRESMSSLLTDPPFSLQSPSSARGKIKNRRGFIDRSFSHARFSRRCFRMNEKKKKTTSVYRLIDVCIKVWLITFSSILVVRVFIATKCFL